MSRFGEDARDDREGNRQPEWDQERARAIEAERREPARLIWQAWDQDLTREELDRVRDFVALRMFDPMHEVPVPEELWYVEYERHVYRPGDRELTGTIHYLKHAVILEEWPEGITEEQYYMDLQSVVFDPDSKMFLSRFYLPQTNRYVPQLGIIGSTDEGMRGPEGRTEILLEHRLDTQHWATGFQMDGAERRVRVQERSNLRRELRWIR